MVTVKMQDGNVACWQGNYSWESDGEILSVFDDDAGELVAQYNGWIAVSYAKDRG